MCRVPWRCLERNTGFDFRTIAINPTKYLWWLLRRVTTSGVRVIQRRVGSFKELESFDLIVNCAGLASTALVPDPSLTPARGVLLHVELKGPPLDRYYYSVKDLIYIIPRPGSGVVVFGGSFEPGVTDKTVSKELTDSTSRPLHGAT
jgi:glycine/D-amino acid oxidase-like deaminating enzyme